jgi:hypothetical protein
MLSQSCIQVLPAQNIALRLIGLTGHQGGRLKSWAPFRTKILSSPF